MLVRDATAADAAACAAVYAPYVRDTAVSFEEEVPTEATMRARIAAAQERWAWLVAQDDSGRVVGYAYGGPFKDRAAYRWSCEVSVYLEAGCRRSGAGRALYEVLLARLTELGFRTAAAGMTLPNPASEGFHAAMGFAPVGVFRRVGFKQGRWHDVAWAQRPLAAGDPAEGAPTA
jgi:L-amino acid N-acyltransferase YncA